MRNINYTFSSYCLFELEILRLSLSIKIGIEKKLKFQGTNLAIICKTNNLLYTH